MQHILGEARLPSRRNKSRNLCNSNLARNARPWNPWNEKMDLQELITIRRHRMEFGYHWWIDIPASSRSASSAQCTATLATCSESCCCVLLIRNCSIVPQTPSQDFP
eukprot:65776-Amphidinium_carterae.1